MIYVDYYVTQMGENAWAGQVYKFMVENAVEHKVLSKNEKPPVCSPAHKNDSVLSVAGCEGFSQYSIYSAQSHYGWINIPKHKFFSQLNPYTKKLSIEQWSNIFSMVRGKDTATDNLCVSLVHNIPCEHQCLGTLIIKMLMMKNSPIINDEKFLFLKHMFNDQFIYKNAISPEILIHIIKNAPDLKETLNHPDIIKVFFEKYNHWLNFGPITLKGL